MVDWRSSEVLALTSFVFDLATVFSLGFYGWYLVLSLRKVEFGLVTRRIRFQVAHVCYLTARYAHLISLIAIVTAGRAKLSPFTSCTGIGLMRVVSVMDDLALAASSGNLALRAIVLWRDKPSVAWTLRSLCAAHLTYALILGIAGVQGRWVPELQTCVLDADAARVPLVAFLAFTILWDLSILLLTVSGMRRVDLCTASPLWSTLMTQGVAYASVALLTCIPIAVFYCLDLNPIMNIILFAPGSTISVVVSSSAVSTLLGMSEASQKGAQSTVPSSRRRSSRRARTVDNKTGDMLTTIVHLNESRTSSEVNEPTPLDNIKPSASEDMELGLGPSKR